MSGCRIMNCLAFFFRDAHFSASMKHRNLSNTDVVIRKTTVRLAYIMEALRFVMLLLTSVLN